MPQLGETVTEGTITRWFKQVGDPIAVDDVLFEVSTDKVDTEVPSAYAGFLRADPRAPRATPSRSARRSRSSPTPPTSRSTTRRPAAAACAERRRRPTRAPAAAATGAARDRAPAGRGRAGRRRRTATGSSRPSCAACSTSTASTPATSSARGATGASPAADVLAAAANRPRRPAAGRAAAARRAHRPPSAVPAARRRRRGGRVHPGPAGTAEHMVRSLATQRPHARRHRGRLPRASIRCAAAAGLSFLPFVARAVVDALARVPARQRRRSATTSSIVHRAHPPRHRRRRRLRGPGRAGACATPAAAPARAGRRRSPTSAERARTKRLTADDLSGGTFTITNVGRLRHPRHRADHQPAPGGDPLDRRREDAAGRRAHATAASGRWPSTPSATSASASTTGPSTGPTPRPSWPGCASSSRPATGRRRSDGATRRRQLRVRGFPVGRADRRLPPGLRVPGHRRPRDHACRSRAGCSSRSPAPATRRSAWPWPATCGPGYDWFFPYYRDQALVLGLGVTPDRDAAPGGGLGRRPARGGRQMPSPLGAPGASTSSPSRARPAASASRPSAAPRRPATSCAGPTCPGCSAHGDELTYVTLGEGACSEGEFWESLNTACTLHLPVLYVVADNGFAISVPAHRPGAGAVAELVRGFRGLDVHRLDGTDYFARPRRRPGRSSSTSAPASARRSSTPTSSARTRTRPPTRRASTARPRSWPTRPLHDPIDAHGARAGRRPACSPPDEAAALRAEAKEIVAEAAAEALAGRPPDPAHASPTTSYVLPDLARPARRLRGRRAPCRSARPSSARCTS